jgi:putative lipase involved disintegration of autophagic bodies
VKLVLITLQMKRFYNSACSHTCRERETSSVRIAHLDYKKAGGYIRSVGEWLGDIMGEIRRMHPILKIWGIGHSLVGAIIL